MNTACSFLLTRLGAFWGIGLLQLLQNLVRSAYVRDGTADAPIYLNPVVIDDQRGPQCNVLATVAFGVQQAILADDLGIRIAEDGQLALSRVLPDFACMGGVIDADSHNPRILRIEVWLSLRELAQLLYAEWSPVSAIEIQHYSVSALR